MSTRAGPLLMLHDVFTCHAGEDKDDGVLPPGVYSGWR